MALQDFVWVMRFLNPLQNDVDRTSVDVGTGPCQPETAAVRAGTGPAPTSAVALQRHRTGQSLDWD